MFTPISQITNPPPDLTENQCERLRTDPALLCISSIVLNLWSALKYTPVTNIVWHGGVVDLSLPSELTKALEADEAQELNEIIRAHREDDFERLRKLATDPIVKREYRNKALYALGRWRDPSVVPDIERVLPSLTRQDA
jgi:hypothetical protein